MSKDLQIFQELVWSKKWIFAKTYAETAPHEYVLRKMYTTREFNFMVGLIRRAGFYGRFGKCKPTMYLIMGNYYYWTMGAPVKETTVINRASLDQYELLEGNRWSLKEGVIPDENIH